MSKITWTLKTWHNQENKSFISFKIKQKRYLNYLRLYQLYKNKEFNLIIRILCKYILHWVRQTKYKTTQTETVRLSLQFTEKMDQYGDRETDKKRPEKSFKEVKILVLGAAESWKSTFTTSILSANYCSSIYDFDNSSLRSFSRNPLAKAYSVHVLTL